MNEWPTAQWRWNIVRLYQNTKVLIIKCLLYVLTSEQVDHIRSIGATQHFHTQATTPPLLVSLPGTPHSSSRSKKTQYPGLGMVSARHRERPHGCPHRQAVPYLTGPNLYWLVVLVTVLFVAVCVLSIYQDCQPCLNLSHTVSPPVPMPRISFSRLIHWVQRFRSQLYRHRMFDEHILKHFFHCVGVSKGCQPTHCCPPIPRERFRPHAPIRHFDSPPHARSLLPCSRLYYSRFLFSIRFTH